MSLLRRIVFAATVFAGVACSSDSVVGPGDLQRFAQAKARWDARPFTDYTYEIQTLCFCVPDVTRWTRVHVHGGVVVYVEAVEPDPNFPITGTYWEPIDSLFATLHQRMTEGSSYLAEIIVEYDPQYGYPVNIEYREKPNIADAGSVIHVRNVVPLITGSTR